MESEGEARADPSVVTGDHQQQTQDVSMAASSSSSSVEALLSVPISLIMRELPTPQQQQSLTNRPRRRRTLLTRSEANVLLRVSQLALEHDVLVELASTTLQNAQSCHYFRQRIEESCRWSAEQRRRGQTLPAVPTTVAAGRSAGGGGGGENNDNEAAAANIPEQQQPMTTTITPSNPPLRHPQYLLALLPLLSVHTDDVLSRAVSHVQREVGRILAELYQCASSLRQFAEQNWTVSEHLVDADDTGGGAGGVGRDKAALAEIEEAVCDRIEGLVGMAVDDVGQTDDDEKQKHDRKSTSKKRKRGKEADGIAQDVFDACIDSSTGKFVSMGEQCHRLFGDLEEHEESDQKDDTVESDQKPAAAAETQQNNTATNDNIRPMDIDEPSMLDANNSKDSTLACHDEEMNEESNDQNKEVQHNNTNGTPTPSSASQGNDVSTDNISGKSDEHQEEEEQSDDEEVVDRVVEIDDNDDNDGPRDDSASSSTPERGQLTQSAAAVLAVLAST